MFDFSLEELEVCGSQAQASGDGRGWQCHIFTADTALGRGVEVRP